MLWEHSKQGNGHLPHVVLGAAPTLLRMFVAFRVEVERDLGVDADTEVVVHRALLVVILPAEHGGGDRKTHKLKLKDEMLDRKLAQETSNLDE